MFGQIPPDYPDKIKSIRKNLKLTQEQFAQKLNVDFATVNRWENGHRKPRLIAWLQIERLNRGQPAAITQSNRYELLERALLAIESLCMDAEDPIIGKIYMISHAALGHCGNPHEDWLKLIEECEREGLQHKIYDAGQLVADLKEAKRE